MKRNSGFISLIITIIIALAAANYFFGWSIFEAAETEEGQGTVGYIREVLNTLWYYIEAPIMWIWNKITAQ